MSSTESTEPADWQRAKTTYAQANEQRRHAAFLLDKAQAATTLDQLIELAEARTSIDAAIGNLVATARHDGVSWSEIGAMLGTTKQAAQQRYGRSRT